MTSTSPSAGTRVLACLLFALWLGLPVAIANNNNNVIADNGGSLDTQLHTQLHNTAKDDGFQLVFVWHTPLAPPPDGPFAWTEQRGFHFVLAPETEPDVVFGCGIIGEVAALNVSCPEKPVALAAWHEPWLWQARTLLAPSPHELLVAYSGLLDVDVSKPASPRIAQNITLPYPLLVSHDNGVNGLALHAWNTTATAALSIGRERQAVLGAAMPGYLHLFDASRKLDASRLGSVATGDFECFDITIVPPGSTHPTPVAAVVNARSKSRETPVIRLYEFVNSAADGSPRHPSQWQVVGELSLPSDFTGCNRVRARGSVVFFSCFGNNVVAFVDVRNRQSPNMFSVVDFSDEQPTGMLVVHDALFVAGGRQVMVFNVTEPLEPSVAAVCVEACGKVLQSPKQNAHSVAVRRTKDGRPLLYLTAQIDNNLGAVEIVSPAVLSLLG
eukprot:m.199480 g.199480  ORF g.199480 m.199480 type:complete len:442 (-) comp18388_c0_seq1:200-1525(-)